MYFDPKTNRYPYPSDTASHYLEVKKNRGIVFDENYPYIDKSKSFRFKRFLIRIVLLIFVFPLVKIRLGIKVNNKANLKKYKDVINKGIISVTNHIHMWDYLTLLRTVKPFKPYVIVWAPNINGENGSLIRMVGGIPIPENNYRGTMKYYNVIKDLLTKDKGWLHIYAEGSMWEYYAPIRPLKRGSSFFAVQFNKPVLPIAYSYRKPTWIRRVLFKQLARITVNIGEPLYPNKDIEGAKEQELDLTTRVHETLCRLSGIDPKDNPYPPIYNNSKRVDYYTSEYGVGYKGSW